MADFSDRIKIDEEDFDMVVDGEIQISIVKGDLTKENVDAITNAANSYLAHGGGLAGAIVRAGGKIIQEESSEYVRENGPVPTGGACVTGAGQLPCMHIVHTVGPIYNEYTPEMAEYLLQCSILNTL